MDTDNKKETGLTPQQAGELIGCSAYTVKELHEEIAFLSIG